MQFIKLFKQNRAQSSYETKFICVNQNNFLPENISGQKVAAKFFKHILRMPKGFNISIHQNEIIC